MRNMGVMAHFCINKYGMSPDAFQEAFLRSPVSTQIAKGNPRYLVGYSGKELADLVLSDRTHTPSSDDEYTITPEYWAGWVLAYYQWYTCESFSQIHLDGLTFSRILRMYNPLHEADLSKFLEFASTPHK